MATSETKIIRKLTLVSILGNVLLTAFKMFAGIVGKSSAMVSDAIHSLSDVLTTFIAAFGVKLAQRRSDRDHPYGHERLECVASLILALVLGIAGFMVGRTGIINICRGDYQNLAVPTVIALVAAIVSILTKEAMYWYTRYYAKKINSAAFLADAWHHRSDALSSIGSLIGIAGAMCGFPIMDALASVIICLFIFKVTFDIAKDAIKKMLDTSCDAKFEQELAGFIAAQTGVCSIDLLQTRMFGNRIYIDLEISVDGNQTLRAAHTIAENVHTALETQYPAVKHVMVHVNPAAPTTVARDTE